MIESTLVQIDLKAILHNFRLLKARAGAKTKILTVVKADAYGHGMPKVARLLDRSGADYFGVADINEGINLRKNGIKKPILIFENALPQFAKYIVDAHLTATVCTFELAAALDFCAKKAKKKVPIHIKIDTGMGRLGVWHTDALPFIAAVYQFPNLIMEGVYTHFPSADTDKNFTQNQINILTKLVFQIQKIGIDVRFVHAANSAGLVGFKSNILNIVRPGLMLYGMYPHAKFRSQIRLKPAMSVHTRIMFIKYVTKGRSISYGRTFRAQKSMIVATLPIGYSDGYFRILSNQSFVLIGGKKCPLIGRVTMDQIMVDVTHVKNVKIGDEAVVLGRQNHAEISADMLGRQAGTINYEITCSLGSRIPRIYV